jgi:hypothetical protein
MEYEFHPRPNPPVFKTAGEFEMGAESHAMPAKPDTSKAAFHFGVDPRILLVTGLSRRMVPLSRFSGIDTVDRMPISRGQFRRTANASLVISVRNRI